jgi:hypothetical protein
MATLKIKLRKLQKVREQLFLLKKERDMEGRIKVE